MPAGSGPAVATASAVTLAADTAEHVLCTLPAGNWNTVQDNLLEFAIMFTGAAPGTITWRVRQGTAITGTLVGVAPTTTAAASAVALPGLVQVDSSAFGLAQQQGQYVLTYQQSANSLGTVNSAVLVLETIAPVQ